MGLLDRFKKKETNISESNQSNDVGDSEFLDEDFSEEDLFSSDRDDDLDEFDEIDSIESVVGEEIPENTAEKVPPKRLPVKKIISFLFFCIVATLAASSIWYYISMKTYWMAEETVNNFFNALNSKNFDEVKSCLDSSVHEDNLSDLLQYHSFYFDGISNPKFNRNNFKQNQDSSSLEGSVSYGDATTAGFNIEFKPFDDSLKISDFKMQIKARKQRLFQKAFEKVEKFLKSLPNDEINDSTKFKETIWQDSTDPAALEELFNKLRGLKFKNDDFSSDKFLTDSLLERTYTGILETDSGKQIDGEITVLYDKGVDDKYDWWVTFFNFKPRS